VLGRICVRVGVRCAQPNLQGMSVSLKVVQPKVGWVERSEPQQSFAEGIMLGFNSLLAKAPFCYLITQ
jgi:hypothetical protein